MPCLFLISKYLWFKGYGFQKGKGVLSEVLVSAPPVGPDHIQSLVSSNLMEVRISNIVLLSINWKSSVSVWFIVLLVNLSKSVSPVSDHSLLLWNLKLKSGAICYSLCKQHRGGRIDRGARRGGPTRIWFCFIDGRCPISSKCIPKGSWRIWQYFWRLSISRPYL